MAIELIAELNVKGKLPLTLTVNPESTNEYFILTSGQNIRTFPNTHMGEADVHIAFEREVWDRMNFVVYPGRVRN